MSEEERKNYCKDCDRSIWGKNPFKCDTNIADNGYYNLADDKCYCKITNGKRAEKYSWEESNGE